MLQTNNSAELTAISRALETVEETRALTIITDSRYSIDCITDLARVWKTRGWRTSRGHDVSHLHLITKILRQVSERKRKGTKTYIAWVKGHEDDEGNEAADELARSAAERAQEAAAGRPSGWCNCPDITG